MHVGRWPSLPAPPPRRHPCPPFTQDHTHEYCGIGGSAKPIDSCFESSKGCDQSGATFAAGYGELPSCAPGYESPYFPASAKGTVMSYCHLLAGGENNIVS